MPPKKRRLETLVGTSELQPGPATLRELLDFAPWILQCLRNHEALLSRFQEAVCSRGVMIRSFYSGMDTPLLAAGQLQAALMDPTQQPARGFRSLHAVDHAHECQVCLQ